MYVQVGCWVVCYEREMLCLEEDEGGHGFIAGSHAQARGEELSALLADLNCLPSHWLHSVMDDFAANGAANGKPSFTNQHG